MKSESKRHGTGPDYIALCKDFTGTHMESLELREEDDFTVYAAQACNNLVYIKEYMTMTFFTDYHDIKPYAFDSDSTYDS